MRARTERACIPEADDQSGWDELFERQEAACARLNAGTLERYRPHLQSQTVAGLGVEIIVPQRGDAPCDAADRRIIYLHGGGYTLFSARSTLFASVPLAHDLGCEVWSIDYPRAPRSKYDETVPRVARTIAAIVDLSTVPVVLVGDSAGGGLAVAATLQLRELDLPTPAAMALWSPWTDLSNSGESHQRLKAADPALHYDGDLENAALAYAPQQQWTDPHASPVHGDFDERFPPTLVQCGTLEILLSDALRLHCSLGEAGCRAELDLYEGMYHSFQAITPETAEARRARARMREFFGQTGQAR